MGRQLSRTGSAASQRGAVQVLVAAAIVALLAAAGIALDGGHIMLNKTRLQNLLDASALDAAKTLDLTRDTTIATGAARNSFADNANESGNHEIAAALAAGDIVLSVEFSDTIETFVPGGANPRYVRVRVDDFPLQSWFLQVLGVDKRVAATAVAGPSPSLATVCDIAPVMVCGDPDEHDPDGTPPKLFGYELDSVVVLKSGSGPSGNCLPSGDGNDCGEEAGPGNFQLLALNCSGASPNCLQRNLAGAYENCLMPGDQITTEPGNNTGPVAAGVNTRFGCYGGGQNNLSEFPPDKNTCRGTGPDYSDYNHDDYQAGATCPGAGTNNHADGIGQRRVIKVPIVDCAGHDINGQTSIPTIGYGCFFLLDAVPFSGPTGCSGSGGDGGNHGSGGPDGGGGQESKIIGQFVKDCGARGFGGPDPGAGDGPYVIQLYKDPGNVDS